ncbi:S9 family peptidase [Alkalihalobacterium bogoriense]|uniref:S9 family peptidase n=1 Tax=Alkalihalobacterium bogoriense TaxID=246272 RepID=UPI00047C703F|nr:S9 family peptidase [Alkalihalobacterium bogoriense]
MANKRPMTIDDLCNIKVVSEPQISPCGTKLAQIHQVIDEEKEYQSHLYIQCLHSGKLTQWTFGKVRDHSPRWSPDGSSIAFISNRSGKPQVWLIQTSGGEAQQVTFCKNGVSNPLWSPDGSQLAIQTSLKIEESIEDKEEKNQEKKKSEPLVINRLSYKSDAAGFANETYTHIAIVQVKTKEIKQLTYGPFDHQAFSWSPNGEQLAITANRTEDSDYQIISDIFTLTVSTGELTLLTNEKGIFQKPTWSPDGKTIACFGHELEYSGATINQIYLINLETKRKECITKTWDVHIGDAAISDARSGHPNPGPVWSKDGDRIFFTASENGNTGLYQIELNNEITAIYHEVGHVFGFDVHVKSNLAVLAISDPSNPGDLYSLTIGEKGKKRLTNVNEAFLREVDLSLPEPITAPSKDGWDIHGWLMKPIGFEEGKKYPMILEIHGGPHAMYANSFFHELQVLAAQGYAVLFMNPRGSHGYGQKFVDACRGDYGGMDYEDLMASVDYVLEQYDFIDESRLGVTGGSYGGFMTNWIVGHTNRFKAAATLRSISNWTSFYGVSDIGYFFTKWEIGSCFLEDPEKLWYHSPLRYVKQIETPLLILHGENDYRCPIEQAEQLYIALKHQKKDTMFVRFPESNHELSRSGPPHLRLERLEHLVNWFNKKM